MDFIDQNSKELKLTLKEGELDKSALNIIKSKTIEINNFSIEYGILGASHFVSITKNGKTFSEIFACIDIPNTDSLKLGSFLNLSREIDENYYSFDGIVKDWEYDDGEDAYIKSLDLVNKHNGLSFEFPSENEGEFKAITDIVVYEENGSIHVETIHAYPNENNVVVTHSTFHNY
jgi:hypothetical protein